MTTPRLLLRQRTSFLETSWVEGVFDRRVNFVQQPDDVRLGMYGPLATNPVDANETLTLIDDDWNFVSMLPECPGNPWEALGSDHNSGILWFGPNKAMDTVVARLQTKVMEHLATLTVEPQNDYFELPVWLSWSFDDGARLVMVYTDVGYQDFDLNAVEHSGVVQALWGAHTDDLMLNEFLRDVARPLLALRGFPVPRVDDQAMEDDNDDEDEQDLDESLDRFSVGSRKARVGDAGLLLSLTRRVFCDLMGWHQRAKDLVSDVAGGSEGARGVSRPMELENSGDDLDEDDDDGMDDPNDHALAQTVTAWTAHQRIMDNLSVPVEAETIHLGITQGTSNKVYLVELIKQDGGYVVRTHHGKRGKGLTPTVQNATPLPLRDAGELYLGYPD